VYFLSTWLNSLVDLGLLCEVPQSHADASHSVELLWMNDQTAAETTHNTHKRQTSNPPPPPGLKPTIPASKQP